MSDEEFRSARGIVHWALAGLTLALIAWWLL